MPKPRQKRDIDSKTTKTNRTGWDFKDNNLKNFEIISFGGDALSTTLKKRIETVDNDFSLSMSKSLSSFKKNSFLEKLKLSPVQQTEDNSKTYFEDNSAISLTYNILDDLGSSFTENLSKTQLMRKVRENRGFEPEEERVSVSSLFSEGLGSNFEKGVDFVQKNARKKPVRSMGFDKAEELKLRRKKDGQKNFSKMTKNGFVRCTKGKEISSFDAGTTGKPKDPSDLFSRKSKPEVVNCIKKSSKTITSFPGHLDEDLAPKGGAKNALKPKKRTVKRIVRKREKRERTKKFGQFNESQKENFRNEDNNSSTAATNRNRDARGDGGEAENGGKKPEKKRVRARKVKKEKREKKPLGKTRKRGKADQSLQGIKKEKTTKGKFFGNQDSIFLDLGDNESTITRKASKKLSCQFLATFNRDLVKKRKKL